MAEVAYEAGGERAIDDPMVVGEADWQHHAWLKRGAVPDRRHLRTYDAKDRHLGRVDDWGKGRAADTAKGRDGEARALHVASPKLALPCPFGDGAHLPAQFGDALAVHITQHRHHQTVRRVHGDPDMVVFLQDKRVLLR